MLNEQVLSHLLQVVIFAKAERRERIVVPDLQSYGPPSISTLIKKCFSFCSCLRMIDSRNNLSTTMAKEIYLLGYDDSLPDNSRRKSLGRYADHLQKLGVGRDFKPMIFSPKISPYDADAAFMAEQLGTTSIHTTEFMATHWPMPFMGGGQANACIIGGIAHTLHQEGGELGPGDDAQMIVVAQAALAQEFLRLNPNGVSTDYFNEGHKPPLYHHYFVQHVQLG
jgi:hypothetical protein